MAELEKTPSMKRWGEWWYMGHREQTSEYRPMPSYAAL